MPRALTEPEKKEMAETLPHMDEHLKSLLNRYHTSPVTQYWIQKTAFGSDITLFVEQFNDEADLNAKAPARFKFDTASKAVVGHGGHADADAEDLELVQLRCVWRACKQHTENQMQALVSNPTNFEYKISTGERNNLNSIYKMRQRG